MHIENKATSLKSTIPAASSRVLRRFLPPAPVVAVKEVALKLLALIPRGKPRGFLLRNYKTKEVFPDQAIYIPPNSVQYIENSSTGELAFICIVDPAWKKEDEKIINKDKL